MEPALIDVKAAAKQQALMTLATTNNGVLNPSDVVEAARDPQSPLHDEFEWNDALAADGFRLAQANALIRRMRLTIVRTEPNSPRVTMTLTREYQSRPALRAPDGGYEPLVAILGDDQKKAELLEQVAGELRSVRRRYENLQELGAIWQAIDELALTTSVAPKQNRRGSTK